MEPKYKVGDKVRIIKRIGNCSDYRFAFVDEMAILEGKVYKISHIGTFHANSYSVPDDGYNYALEGSGGFSWASSMFELVMEHPSLEDEETPLLSKEEPKVLDFTHKKKYYQLNFSV